MFLMLSVPAIKGVLYFGKKERERALSQNVLCQEFCPD